MSESLLIILGYLLSPITAALVLIIFIMRGHLRPAHFNHIEPRITPLRFLDLFIGFWILLAGGVLLLSPLLQLAGYGEVPAPEGPMSNATADSIDPMRLAITALLGQLTTQLPVVLFICYRLASVPGSFKNFGFTKLSVPLLLAGLLAFLAAMPMVTGTSSLMALLSRWLELDTPTVAHDLLKALLDSEDAVARSLIMISAVVIAPLLEEIIFRGLVQSALLDLLGTARRWLMIFIAGALFSLIHMQGVSWHALPGLFILGLILGWLYETHRSLWPCIIVHVLFNAANVGLGLLQSSI